MPARVRGAGLRQTKSRVPEVPEQETGAAALRVRGFGEERRREPAVFLGGAGGTLRVVRSRGRARGLLAKRSRLSRLFKFRSVSTASHGTGFINDLQPGRDVPQGLKPAFFQAMNDTAGAVPLPKLWRASLAGQPRAAVPT